ILQNTCLIALGTARSGFSDSPAVIPINSVPWNENPATKNTPRIVSRLPSNPSPRIGPPPLVNVSKPTNSPPIIPRIVSRPIPIKIITVTTLINANQYSLSPYTLTDNAFSPNIIIKNKQLQLHAGIPESGVQY